MQCHSWSKLVGVVAVALLASMVRADGAGSGDSSDDAGMTLVSEPVAPLPPGNAAQKSVDADPAYVAPPAATGQACPSPRQPWKLPQPSFLQSHNIALGGWLEQGITFSNHPDAFFNGPIGTNDWNGEYQMNQFWLFLDRPADTGGCGGAWGGHVDMIYGTDWRFGINHGLEDRINDFNRQSYGLVVPQAYLELAYNDLSVKLGHYAGILSYEQVPAVANTFYSHSYAMAFCEPLLVTGALAAYKLDEQWLIQGGFNRGWMMFEDNNNALDFMGGIKWTSKNKKTSVAFAVDSGPQDPDGVQDRFVSSLIFQQQVTEKFKYVLQNDLGRQKDAVSVGQSAEWCDICQYLLYQINPKWSANMRAEWLQDQDGVRVGGPPPQAGIRAWPSSGFAGNFYELTVGLNWRPKPNIVFRPELRYDWYAGPTNASGELPFNNGAGSDQFLAAGDLIITF